MTLPAPRLCDCGCKTVLTRRSNESQSHFKARKFVSQEHGDAYRTAVRHSRLPVGTCEKCGATYGKRRHPSGKYESRRDFENRRHCADCTRPWNSGENRQPAKPPTPLSPFNPATRLPDPRPFQTLTDNPRFRQALTDSPKNESNMKRLPSLLEAERASGVTLELVPIEQFKCAARRAKRYHPEFAAMLKGQEVRGPVAGEVAV